jgi:hypothetical protein
MKKINIIFLFVAFICILASCSKKFLDLIPQDQLTDATFWKTENYATLALTGLYGQSSGDVNKSSTWESHWNILWWDLMTDNGYSQFPWDNISVMGNGQLNASNPGRSYFSYSQIRKCNNFLEHIDQVKMDTTKRAIYKAEARFLRAYDYYRKVEFYGDVPLVTKTFANPSDAKIAASPKSVVVDFILNELSEVAKILPVQNMRQSKGHVTSGSALALKARLELYEGKFPDAMADAKKVIEMPVYELYPDYGGLFSIDNESNNKESILEVEYAQNDYPNNIWQHVLPAKEGGWSSISGVQSIVDAYTMTNGKAIDDPTSGYDANRPFVNRDPRLAMTILYPGAWFDGRFFDSLDPNSPDYHQNAAAPRSGYNILKYSKVVPSSLLQNGGENVMVIRLAEMYLIYAEAGIESGVIDQSVLDAINKVRARAYGVDITETDKYPAVTTYDQTELRKIVRNERRVELAFEGLRYFDIKRWNIGAQVLNGPLYGSLEGSVNSQTGVVTWGSTRIKLEDRIFRPERNYLLPIPQGELDANPNIKQNPGY